MTRADLLAAKRKGHTYVISRDMVRLGQPVEHKIISTHRNYEEARRKLEGSKGNAIYKIDDLLKV